MSAVAEASALKDDPDIDPYLPVCAVSKALVGKRTCLFLQGSALYTEYLFASLSIPNPPKASPAVEGSPGAENRSVILFFDR